VKLLIEKGADFKSPDKNGKTPLHCAAEGGSLEVVKHLIDVKGVDCNVKSNNGNTPLHVAAWEITWI